MADVTRIRPLEVDRLRTPTMVQLENARDAAKRRGDFRRALAYEIVRFRRLRQAQRGELDEQPEVADARS